MFDEDIDQYFEDGEVALWQSTDPEQPDALVILDEPDEVVLSEGVVISSACTITYPTEKLQGLKENDFLTVGDTRYRVREKPRRIDDGRITKAVLSKG